MIIGFGAIAASGVVMAVTGVRRAQQLRQPATTVAAADVTAPLPAITRSGAGGQVCCRQDSGTLTVLPASRCQSSNGESVSMELCNAVFKPVCCRRADNAPYWSTGQWCDDVGGAVDDSLCEGQSRETCCEYEEGTRLPENRLAWISRDECRRTNGLERSEDHCAVFLENVCCEQNGRVSEVMRRDCQTSANRRIVDASQCEPVCCRKPNAQANMWESRGNCGGKASPNATMVDDTRCEEVCCQLPDRTMRRLDRRDCAAHAGLLKSIVDCGTTVEVERPDLPADPDVQTTTPKPPGPSELGTELRPPPVASPFQ